MRAFPTGWLRRSAPIGLAALFLGSGTLLPVRPGLYLALIPSVLPVPGAIILASGIAELVCAGGLLARARWAGPRHAGSSQAGPSSNRHPLVICGDQGGDW